MPRFTAAQKDVMKKSSMRWKQVGSRFIEEIENMSVISQRLLQNSSTEYAITIGGGGQWYGTEEHSVF